MIVAFLYIFAVLEIGYGIGILVGSQNEILGALAIGFSILTVGLASIRPQPGTPMTGAGPQPGTPMQHGDCLGHLCGSTESGGVK